MATKKASKVKALVGVKLDDEEALPVKKRIKADVGAPRNVRAPSQVKDEVEVKDVTQSRPIAQVATTKKGNQSTTTKKRGSKARY